MPRFRHQRQGRQRQLQLQVQLQLLWKTDRNGWDGFERIAPCAEQTSIRHAPGRTFCGDCRSGRLGVTSRAAGPIKVPPRLVARPASRVAEIDPFDLCRRPFKSVSQHLQAQMLGARHLHDRTHGRRQERDRLESAKPSIHASHFAKSRPSAVARTGSSLSGSLESSNRQGIAAPLVGARNETEQRARSRSERLYLEGSASDRALAQALRRAKPSPQERAVSFGDVDADVLHQPRRR